MAFPTGSKVSPIHSEYGITSSEISRYHQNEEFSSPSKQELTLEKTRYANMRGRTNPVSSAGKLVKQSTQTEDEFMKEMRNFIKLNFKQKECCRFVPVPNKEVKMTQELKCRCGEVFTGHRNKDHNISPLPSSIPKEHDHFIPNGLQDVKADENLDKPHPKDLPSLQWNIKKDISLQATCTFGKIIFLNMEHNGETKPAKYIRLSNKDNVNKALKLMVKYWQIMDPTPPSLVISVVGGAKNFKLDGRMRDTFNNGLIRAAKTTNAWLITSGFNMGVMKSVGQAVQQGQSFSWDNDHMTHLLRCIGIAPWGYVKDRHLLEGNDDKGKFPAHVEVSNVIEHGKAVPLNPDHTHFIFVDDGFRNRYEGVALFRAQLEQKIKAPKSAKGLDIPLVLVVVEGGIQAINHVHTSLLHDIPVVICSGTGRAADIIAYAYSHTKTEKNKRVMNSRHEMLRDKIVEAYEEYLKPSKVKDQNKDMECDKILKKVKECCQKEELITIFHMNKHEDLDSSILKALRKAKKCKNPNTCGGYQQ